MTITKETIEKARAWYASAPSLDLQGIELRDYQVEAGWASYLHDTLVVLPTGLGKTMVALLHAGMLCADMTEEKEYKIIVMVAPTRALLVQHHELFASRLRIGKENVHIVDGGMDPAKRQAFYAFLAQDAPAVLFMTPQTLDHDLQHDRFPRDKLASLILDEAHHATLDHPYVLIYNDLVHHHAKPRILAMTASPGETEEEIGTLCNTLGIDPAHAIFKAREDGDVAPYIHAITVRRIGVDLPVEWRAALDALVTSLAQCCTWLVMAGIAEADVVNGKQFKKAIPKMFFLDLFQKFSAEAAGGPGKYTLLSRLATCIKLHHAVEMLETYGIDALLDYHESLLEDFKKRGTRATREVLLDQGYNAAVQLAGEVKAKGEGPARHHPKLIVLRQLLTEFLTRNPTSKILVFVNYRASIDAIVSHVGPDDPVIKIHKFVGQGTRKKNDAGMKRDAQSRILQQFKGGAYNVLVATSVAEEGLDIAECDLVVFYETVASLIKFIQRQGRTGRKRAGNTAVLFTRGTMDEFRMKALDAKLAKIHGVYYNVQTAAAGSAGALLGDAAPKPRPRLQQRIEAFAAGGAAPGEARVSITDLKRWQDAVPVVISSGSVVAGELAEALKAAKVPVSVVPPSGLPDITIGKGLGVLVRTVADVARASLDSSIFALLENLALKYEKSVLVAWDDGAALDDDVTGEMVVDWLERFAGVAGVKVLSTSSIAVLARVVQDVHVHVKEGKQLPRRGKAGARRGQEGEIA
ncbi:MAG: DEAD/DEAH box helicase [Candidatus Lokiarchaeota archaeon]|nr:DEAD/DEAH box helicase [Candidatus Lokiarchaeota archaeon]